MTSKAHDPPGTPWVLAAAATFLAAAVLRFARLESGLWIDEIATLVASVRLPIARILTEQPDLNQHPLYSVLAHASIAMFGESAWALRLPACLFGIATVVMVFLLAVRLTTPVEAWAAATVLAVSYHHIWYSQSARGYTLQGFSATCGTYFLLRGLDSGRVRHFVLYALVSLAGIYAHLTMVLVIAGQGAVLAIGRAVRWRPALGHSLGPWVKASMAAAVLGALAYAPLATGVLRANRLYANQVYAQFASPNWAFDVIVHSVLSSVGALPALLGAAFSLAGAISLWRSRPLASALLVAPGAAMGIVLFALGRPLYPRFFFFMAGAVAIFVARGMAATVESIVTPRVGERPALATATFVVCTLLFVTASAPALARNYRVPKQDFDGAVSFLDAAEVRGARVAGASGTCKPFSLYYGRKSWPCLRTGDDWRVFRAAGPGVLIAYALPEYLPSRTLREHLRVDCREVQRFPGTLVGGDIVVCEPR